MTPEEGIEEEEVIISEVRKKNLQPEIGGAFENTSGIEAQQRRRVVIHKKHHKVLVPWVKTLLGAVVGLILGITLTYWIQSTEEIPTEINQLINNGKYISIHDDSEAIKIFVREDGPIQSDEAILLVDGPPGSFFERKVVPLMSFKGKIRTVSFDFPGVGLSEKPQSASYDSTYLSERISDICDKLNLTKVHLVLHGLMGPVGAHFAINSPHRVATITFVNTFLNTSSFYHTFPVSLLTVRYLRHLVYEFMTRSIFNIPKWLMLRWKFGDKFDYDTSKEISFLLGSSGKWPILRILSNINSTQAQTKYLKQGLQQKCPLIAMQTIWTTNDNFIPDLQDQVKYLRDYLPQIRREVTLSGGHWPQLDEPREYIDCIVRFVNQHRFNKM